ncbi:MAG: AraC family transcriptional regulator [Rhodospirillaceae bacterium]|jgi:AraC-like DNA-binding protein|nr:AraC family transcriptional regulator [Rhodospirillaceae bacterium]
MPKDPIDTPRPDRLSALIQRFRIRAHVLRPMDVSAAEEKANLFVTGDSRPVLVYHPRGGPDFVPMGDVVLRAVVDAGGAASPIAQALPETVTVLLDETPTLAAVADILVEEALAPRCGGRAVIDRLCEVVMIRLLRHLIEAGEAETGLLAGLAHGSLCRALVAMHEQPGRDWRLVDLANVAGMSRTHFSATFRTTIGVTPGGYLSNWRLTLARMDLAKGDALKTVARRVGFSSSAALSRAFSRRFGVSPRQAVAEGANH